MEGLFTCSSCNKAFDLLEAEQMLHIVYIVGRDGDERGQEEFETRADLYKVFPDAAELSACEYEVLYGYDADYFVDRQQDYDDDFDYDHDIGTDGE
jgi:hypothetical protein